MELQLQHQSFSEYSGLISFRIDWFDLLAVQGTLDTGKNFKLSSIIVFWLPKSRGLSFEAVSLVIGKTF